MSINWDDLMAQAAQASKLHRFEADHDSKCPACGSLIQEGDSIAYIEGEGYCCGSCCDDVDEGLA